MAAIITTALLRKYGAMTGIVPDPILRSISQDELTDRLEHAQALLAKARNASDPTLARSYQVQAGATLRALPRADVEQQTTRLLKKAAIMPGPHAAELRDKAEQIRAENPPAPSRHGLSTAIRKAVDAGDVVAVYDHDGNLVGVCDPAKITPIAQPKTPAAEPAEPAQQPQPDVIKAQLYRPGLTQIIRGPR